MAFVDFRLVISEWQNVGVFDVLLPLLLVFTLIYAILEKSKILGGYKSIDAVVSLIISLFVIANPYVTELFVPIFSKAGLAIIILVAMLVIVGLFMKEGEGDYRTFKTIAAIGGIGLFIWLLMAMSNYYTGQAWYFSFKFWWWNNASWVIPLAFLIVVGGIIVASTGRGGKKEKAPAAPPAHAAGRT